MEKIYKDVETETIINSNKKSLKALGSEEDISFTKDYLIYLHDLGIKEFGGTYGIRDEGLLESVAATPYQSVFGTDLYPTPFDKAAKYLLDFARYQVFVDGNKRTGLITCIAFLKANNIELTLSQLDKYNLTMSIANNKITELEQVSKILEENSVYSFGHTELTVDKETEEEIDDIELEI